VTSPDSTLGGGCGRKVPGDILRAALDQVRDRLRYVPPGTLSACIDWGDAAELVFLSPPPSLVTTADLLYAVSADEYLCGYIASIHAVSDLHAVLAVPVWATATVGVSRRGGHGRALFKTLSGVADALVTEEAAFAGGHSVYADEPFVSVAATGVAAGLASWSSPEPGDLLVLTKPLGAGVILTALKLGVVAETDVQDAYDLMRWSNRTVAMTCREIRATATTSVRSVTDVSGFGFLDAVRIVTQGARVVIASGAIPVLDTARSLLGTGSVSPLGDQNMLASDPYTTYENLAPEEEATFRLLLNDPQTSGGLLVVMSPSGVEALLEVTDLTAPYHPTVVGQVVPDEDGENAKCIFVRQNLESKR